jgi:Ca2+-binding EF-hand superfamily protein
MILLLDAFQVILISGCAKKVRKQSSPFDKKAVFDAIDKNRDCKIGKKEYRFIWKDKKMAEEYFNRLDRDNDSFLKDDEFVVPWVTVALERRGHP